MPQNWRSLLSYPYLYQKIISFNYFLQVVIMRPSLSSLSSTIQTPTILSSTAPSLPSTSKCLQLHEVPLQSGRVRKAERERRERKRAIAKLRRMLPQHPAIVRCSELELIHLIMDYITSLQVCPIFTVASLHFKDTIYQWVQKLLNWHITTAPSRVEGEGQFPTFILTVNTFLHFDKKIMLGKLVGKKKYCYSL